jgi:hypothetical protein
MPSFEEFRQSVTQSASGAMEKAKSSMGLTDPEEQKQPDRLDELSEMCPKLTFQQVNALLYRISQCHRLAHSLYMLSV